MTKKQQRPFQSLSTRFAMAQHALARHARLRRHRQDIDTPPSQPRSMPVFMLAAILAIIMITAISLFQLIAAAIG